MLKMDKASIIKDAIEYIQELHEQERRIRAEILELEYGKLRNNHCLPMDLEESFGVSPCKRKKKRVEYRKQHCDFDDHCRSSSIEDFQVGDSLHSVFPFVYFFK